MRIHACICLGAHTWKDHAYGDQKTILGVILSRNAVTSFELGGLSLARSSLVWLKCLAIEPQQSPHLCFLSAGIRGAPSQAWLFMWCWDQTQVLVLMRQACHLLSFHPATVYTSCLAYVSMCSVHVCAYAYATGAHACACTCAHGGIDADTENLPWLLSTLFIKPGPFS